MRRYSDMQISVIVEENIKEGQKDAFVAHMREMIRLTKEEDGCIAYDLYESIEGTGEIVLVELWESKEALDAHLQTDHFKELFPASEVFKAGPPKVRLFGIL